MDLELRESTRDFYKDIGVTMGIYFDPSVDKFIAVDNRTDEMFTEEFDEALNALLWLRQREKTKEDLE